MNTIVSVLLSAANPGDAAMVSPVFDRKIDDYRLKAGRIIWRLKVALRLKPPEAVPAESRLKAWWAR
jgi:hypothetical protein